MIPDQTDKSYLRAIERSDIHASALAADLRDGMRRFWADPIGQAPLLEAQAAACGMTAAGLFQQHGAAIDWLLIAKPSKLTWLEPLPIEMPFLPSGGIDHETLALRWAGHLATLRVLEEVADPEPEEG